MTQFDRPVPGSSLTSPPKAQAYERPPEVTNPKEALERHLENLNSREAIEDIVFFVQSGMDVKTIVEALLRSAVATGLHSIDISLIIAPILHQYIVGRLDALGVEYDEGIDNLKEKEDLRYSRNLSLAKKFLKDMKPNDEIIDEMDLENTNIPSEFTETAEETPPPPTGMGLMQRPDRGVM
jgi:hypothetical protein